MVCRVLWSSSCGTKWPEDHCRLWQALVAKKRKRKEKTRVLKLRKKKKNKGRQEGRAEGGEKNTTMGTIHGGNNRFGCPSQHIPTRESLRRLASCIYPLFGPDRQAETRLKLSIIFLQFVLTFQIPQRSRLRWLFHASDHLPTRMNVLNRRYRYHIWNRAPKMHRKVHLVYDESRTSIVNLISGWMRYLKPQQCQNVRNGSFVQRWMLEDSF